jgi:hypothetical protein
MTAEAAVPALRVMYDSDHMDAIPRSALLVAGYPHRGGDTVWIPGEFSGLVMAIDQRGDHPDDCSAADLEAGAINPANALSWVTTWHHLHPNGQRAKGGFFARPVLYCNLVTLPQVQAEMHGQGLLWDLWVAAWPGQGPVLQDGAVAHQCASQSTGSGGDFDLSVVSAEFGVAPDEPPGWQDAVLADLGVVSTNMAALQARLAGTAALVRANTP